jgi:receptor expression-enhancing protein 5/6
MTSWLPYPFNQPSKEQQDKELIRTLFRTQAQSQIQSQQPQGPDTPRARRRRNSQGDVDEEEEDSLQKLTAFLEKIGPLEALKEKTGVPSLYLGLGLFILFSAITIKLAGFAAFCNFVGLVYPAYMSFKTIETETVLENDLLIEDEDEHIHWLMYWAVYGTFHVGETIASSIFFRIPYYHAFKFALLVWCFLPQTKGSVKVYNSVFRPLLKKHQDNIEQHLGNVQRVGIQATGEISRVGTHFFGVAAQNMAKSFVQTLASQQLDKTAASSVPTSPDATDLSAATADPSRQRSQTQF